MKDTSTHHHKWLKPLLVVAFWSIVVICRIDLSAVVVAPVDEEHVVPLRRGSSPDKTGSSSSDSSCDDEASSAAAAASSSRAAAAEKRKASQSPGIAAVCNHFRNGQTTAAVWRSHVSHIADAAMNHPNDTKGVHKAWIKELLHLLTKNSHLMERGLRSSPSKATMHTLLTKVGNLLLIAKNTSKHQQGNGDGNKTTSSSPPSSSPSSTPLQVVVFGGSVPEGAHCGKLPVEIEPLLPENHTDRKIDKGLNGNPCSWVFRLQLLADALLGPGVVQIHNIAAGGTNSRLALPVLEYRLYPDHLSHLRRGNGPDVIVNAYAANDNLYHWNSSVRATADLRHLHDNVQKATAFYNRARKSRPCPPAIVFLDDYFGNQNGQLLGEDIRNDAVRLLIDDHNNDIWYIAPATVVKHWVHAATDETLFSPDWSRGIDVHFGMPGHQHVAFAAAYSILQSVMEFCEDVNDDDDFDNDDERRPPDAEGSSKNHDGVWRGEECPSGGGSDSDDSTEEPCSFAFVATPAGTVRTVPQLTNYIKPYLTSSVNGGWYGKNDMRNGWQNKLGLVPHQPGASMGLTIPNGGNQTQRILTIHFLKSYGEQWDHSEARINVTVWNAGGRLEHETVFPLIGYHAEMTSLTFPHTLNLGGKGATAGQTVRLDVTLLNGTNFKITAIMLCSR